MLPILAACIGCAQVKPQADFAAVRDEVSQRTSQPDMFDPSAEDSVAAKVRDLVSDGLTIDECVHVALLNNPEIQALFDQVGASRADVVQSQLLTNPNFTITMIWPEGGGRAKVPMGLGQELTDLWQIPVKKKIAQAQLDQTMLSAQHRCVDIATETRTTCYRALAAKRADELAGQHEKFVSDSMKMVAEQSKNPERTPVDVSRLRALLLEAKLANLNAHRELGLANAALGRLLGLSSDDQRWELQDQLPSAEAVTSDLRQLLEQAIQD